MISQAFLPAVPLTLHSQCHTSRHQRRCPTRKPLVFTIPNTERPSIRASISEPRVSEPKSAPIQALSSHLKDIQNVEIDIDTAKCPTPLTTHTTVIQEATLQLPRGYIDSLQVSTDRAAEAAVYARNDVLSKSDLSTTPFVIFAHGFSQLPRNYTTLLRHLAAQGYVIIAPRTWLFSILFTKIETVGFFDSLQAKLQTALLVDSARAFQLASLYSPVVHLCGHSMGGAIMLAYGGYLRSKARSLAVMAPDVSRTRITDLNQTVSLNAKDGMSRLKALAVKLDTRMLVLHGDKDRFVPKSDMLTLFSALKREYCSILCSMAQGTHVGFENSLDVDLPIIQNLDRLLFAILDCVVYGSLDLLQLDTKEQLETAKELLPRFIENVEESSGTLIHAIVSSQVEGVNYRWN